MKIIHKIGIDIGSTTLKIIVLDTENRVVYKNYVRHKAGVGEVFLSGLAEISARFPETAFKINITGSAGMGIAERTRCTFTQEVVAAIEAVETLYPNTRTLIDLGGEDAKIVFFEQGKQPDIRMNGSCAGGTGAFIDQMADLLNITPEELGRQAENYTKIHPVASRCGVFAKTDVQNLIAHNVPVPDVAMSVLQTVAMQAVTTLFRGSRAFPETLCIGGPLTFIPALRTAFRNILKLNANDLILPENSEFFPALGCAFLAGKQESTVVLHEIENRFLNNKKSLPSDFLPPLFKNEEEYEGWKANRKIKYLKTRELQPNEALKCYLGIDSGSTTTKILILDDRENVVFKFYSANNGNPLKTVMDGLQTLYNEVENKNIGLQIIGSCATGYGEDLLRSALNLDFGIVETMAHLQGAQWANPRVSFVLDIGGQDMKSIFVRDGVISNIELNEACSSGCGSFLQNFAATMQLTLSEFTAAACLAPHPADLGTRCTVFMNSKVKQSLRENATIGDISAGLAYSVVKNCLFKVLKIANLNIFGQNIVVQGGTFKNDAVYRALELLSGKPVSATDHPELMGALGAALYAKKTHKDTEKYATKTAFDTKCETKELQCRGCTNQCTVIRFDFANGNRSYAGNKCEKVFFSKNSAKEKGYNAFELKNNEIFNLSANKNTSHFNIGIPRVLNMYENFPFWKTLFEQCGMGVVLSPESKLSLYQSGIGSVMSDNICFPAKLAHGHILALSKMKVDRIFYPIVPKEKQEFDSACNSYNCPVVSGYPEVIRSAINPAGNLNIPFDKPVMNFGNKKALKKQCWQYVSQFGVEKNAFKIAFRSALSASQDFLKNLIEPQWKILRKALINDELIFIVAGRPYHADPLIHQKVGQILSDLGVHALTDDVFRQFKSKDFKNLNLVSQWSYPNRVVQAALAVAKLPQCVQMIQLNSFGCGPDSFFMEETGKILKVAGKNHTILRIDEIASSGAIRLRLRSLIESMKSIRN
ncbi:MAG: acyl-CoA dehydratase activase-related protein [Prevotellaceae bacterium]|jgi:predicted CoA-substrate-specific enzyme activase|nr:acyl-CoA dehydratase activase-related protein [Prevotellaceae bacterium]